MNPNRRVPIVGTTATGGAPMAVSLVVEVLLGAGTVVTSGGAPSVGCGRHPVGTSRRRVVHLEQWDGFQRSTGGVGTHQRGLFVEVRRLLGPQPDAGRGSADQGEDQLEQRWQD